MEKTKIKNKKYLITIVFLLLILLAESFIWPSYFKKSVNLLKEKTISKINIPSLSEKPFQLGFDFKGGTQLVYDIDSGEQNKEEVLTGFKHIVEQRMDVYQREAEIKINNNNLIAEFSLEEDLEMIVEIMKQVPTLEFREESEQEDFFNPTDLTGEYLKEVFLGIDQNDNKPLILLEFNEDGAKILEALTKRNEGKRLGVYIDSIPVFPLQVDKAISGGNVQIKMDSEIESVRRLTQMIKTSSLSPSLKLVFQKTITQQDVESSLNTLKKSTAFGFLAIFWIMIIVYRLMGFISFGVLLIYICLLSVLFRLIPIVVSFDYLFGALMSFAIVLGSNVFIFSKIRKEVEKGKSHGIAFEEGFDKSQSFLKKAHLAILLLSGVMFFFGTEIMKNFAFVLSLGILINLLLLIRTTKKILISLLDTKLKKIDWLWKSLKWDRD